MTTYVSENPSQWKYFYRLAGTMAILITLAGLVDAFTSNLGAGARDNATINILEWFNLFQVHPFSAFSSLGMINMITLSLSIPVYLALSQTHRRGHPVLAALAPVLFFIGAAVYISSNSVFSLFALSSQYALAGAAQKPVLEAAGQALLASGADLTPGTFLGLIMTQVAGLLIASAMLRDSIFGRWTGIFGLAGFGLMSIFFFLSAFAPRAFDLAMTIAMPGGLILMVYQIMLARRFFQLGR